MKKKMMLLLVFINVVWIGMAQNLQNFTVVLSTREGGSNYLSMSNKKAYNVSAARANKQAVDLVLLNSNSWSGPVLEWYNMSGKDDRVPAELRGTATLINAISLDKDQFKQCKTSQDLKRMTSHVTKNSFSYFASAGEKELRYHCFIVQLETGKRGLIWMDAIDAGGYTAEVKMEGE